MIQNYFLRYKEPSTIGFELSLLQLDSPLFDTYNSDICGHIIVIFIFFVDKRVSDTLQSADVFNVYMKIGT